MNQRRHIQPARVNMDNDGYTAAMATKFDHSGHLLELHSVSYIRSFTTGRWYSKLFNPPITAQFLKDVNLQVQGGEVLGIVGSSGSGKTTLLNVIARRVQGTTGGTLLLNHRPLTERFFQNSACYVSFKQNLLPQLTVQETLQYQALLGLSTVISAHERNERISQLIREFELVAFGSVRISALSESSRRRLILAVSLVRDPVLLLVDEPTLGLDALGGYQLMYLLASYMRKYHRICVVTMTVPRSDIYPLLDRLCILFFGELVYSGHTKLMPQYFRTVGFPCPASENPAVYYLSLSTVDRETSERYLETQDKAVKLVETFKTEGFNYVRHVAILPEAIGNNPYLPLAQLGRPNVFVKFSVLVRRQVWTYFKNGHLLVRLLTLPLFSVLFVLFYFRLSSSSQAIAQTHAGLCFNVAAAVSLVMAGLAAPSFGLHRTKFYQENWEDAYSGVTFILSELVSFFVVDLVSVYLFAGIIFWVCNVGDSVLNYLVYGATLWCCLEFTLLQTYCLMSVVRPAFTAACSSMLIVLLHLVSAFGVLKSIQLYRSDALDWLYYLTYASPFRFAGAVLQLLHMEALQLPECASGSLCRYENGMDYMKEVYYPDDYEMKWLNFGICFAFVAAMFLLTLVLFVIPLPHFIKRKFRFK